MDLALAIDGYVAEDGRGGWAVVAERARGTAVVASGAVAHEPSHLVEWRAAAAALAWLERRPPTGALVRLRTDSALVARGLAARRPEMSGEAAELRAECRRALARLADAGVRVRVERVDRQENRAADAAARVAAGASPGPDA